MKNKYGKITVITDRTFKDGYNRLILFDKLTKKAYFIEDVEEKAFRILDTRVMIVILAFVFSFSFWDIIPAVIISGVLFVSFELYYRKFFIPKLREAKEFTVPENAKRVDQLVEKDSRILMLMIVLCLLLPVLLVYYVLEQTVNFTNFSFNDVNMTALVLASIGVGLYSLYIAIACIRALVKKKNKGENRC